MTFKKISELQKDIATDSDMLRSRFEETHGPGGLCDTLVNATNAMLEIRLKIEYGDYFAIHCAKLKEDKFQGFLWKENQDLD